MAEERDVSPARIEEWRRRIDAIDDQLVRLLNSRSACVVEIGRIKRALGLPLYSPEREGALLARVIRENTGPLDRAAVQRLVESDDEIDLFEYVLQKIVLRHLEPRFLGARKPSSNTMR